MKVNHFLVKVNHYQNSLKFNIPLNQVSFRLSLGRPHTDVNDATVVPNFVFFFSVFVCLFGTVISSHGSSFQKSKKNMHWKVTSYWAPSHLASFPIGTWYRRVSGCFWGRSIRVLIGPYWLSVRLYASPLPHISDGAVWLPCVCSQGFLTPWESASHSPETTAVDICVCLLLKKKRNK